MKLTPRIITRLACRLILGGFFIYTGVLKAGNPVLFQQDIRNYHLLPDPWPGLVAISLPWFEIICGLGILVRVLYAGSLALVSLSLVVFMGAISSAWSRNLDIDCGCFGKDGAVIGYGPHLLMNTGLLAMGVWLLWDESRRRQPDPSPGAAQPAI